MISVAAATSLSGVLGDFIASKVPSGTARKYRLQEAAEDLIDLTYMGGASSRLLAKVVHEEAVEDSKWLSEKLRRKRWYVGRGDEPELTEGERARVSAIATNKVMKSQQSEIGALFAFNSLMANVLEAGWLKVDTEPSLVNYAFRRGAISVLGSLAKRGNAIIDGRISELAREQDARREAENPQE